MPLSHFVHQINQTRPVIIGKTPKASSYTQLKAKLNVLKAYKKMRMTLIEKTSTMSLSLIDYPL